MVTDRLQPFESAECTWIRKTADSLAAQSRYQTDILQATEAHEAALQDGVHPRKGSELKFPSG